MAYLVVALSAMTWGTWPLFLRPAGVPPLPSALVVMVLCALPAPFVLRRAPLRDRVATAALMGLGLSNTLNLSCYFLAIHEGPVSVAIFSHYLAPVMVALAAPWVIREPRSRRALVALPVILGGLLLVVGLPGGDFHGKTALIGAASAVGFALNIFATKVASRAYSPMAIMSVSSAITAGVLLALFGRDALPQIEPARIAWLAAGTLLPGFGAGVAYTWGLQRSSAQTTGALCYLEPVSAAIVGTLFLDEPLGLRGAIGATIVVASGVWVAREAPAAPVVAVAVT